MRHPHGQNKGFTLLELLSAFSLVLLIAVMLFGGLRFGNRVWSKSEENLSSQNNTVLIRGLLGDWIGDTYPLFVEGKETLDFMGEVNRLQFIAPMGTNPEAEQLTRIVLNYNQGGKTLTASLGDFSPGQSFERVLLESVETIEFSYYGLAEEEENPQWHTRWEDQAELPDLIKITLQFSAANDAIWPDLIIKPTIDWGINCQFNPANGVCRKGVS